MSCFFVYLSCILRAFDVYLFNKSQLTYLLIFSPALPTCTSRDSQLSVLATRSTVASRHSNSLNAFFLARQFRFFWPLCDIYLLTYSRLAREFQQNLAIISRCRTFNRCAWRCLQICTRTRLSPTWSAVSSDLARLFALLSATRHTKQFTKYNKTLVHLVFS